jgi:hypothetical protein
LADAWSEEHAAEEDPSPGYPPKNDLFDLPNLFSSTKSAEKIKKEQKRQASADE